MLVKDLIEQLEKFPKNMEVKLHNGFVDDWQYFNLLGTELEKWDDDYIYEMAKKQNKRLGMRHDFPKSEMKKEEWTYREYSDIHPNKKYKKVLLINPKAKNKTVFDRVGNMTY